MTDEHREIAGFLCRWLLLALVATVLLGTAWAAALATEAIAVETAADVVLPDGIARERQHVWLVGYVHPPLPYSGSTVMLYRRPGAARPQSASVRGGQVNWYPTAGDAGLQRIEFRGQPYGPLAAEQRSVRLLTVSAHEPVWLIDAEWAGRISRARRDDLAELLARLDSRGAVALFHNGPPHAFEACRDELRANGFQYAVLLDLGEDPAHVLRRTSRRIRRWDHNRNIYVVSDDVELARAAVEDGFHFHLLDGGYQGAEQSRLLTVHESWDELKENLTALPIP